MSKIGHGESEEEQNRRETRFLRLWGACQPTLFAEWEREMDRLEAKEEKRRQSRPAVLGEPALPKPQKVSKDSKERRVGKYSSCRCRESAIDT